MDKRVIPLAVGGLGIGITEFGIMGLLPDIARALQITIPQAGHFISAYALGVVIGAPLLVGFSVRHSPKKVLLGLMLFYSIFNGLSAIANDYNVMLLIRFLSGLPHGAFFGVSTIVAIRLAEKGKEARYISYVFSGLSIANLALVPLVTYIGHTFHWSWYFIIVAFVGLFTLLFIHLWLPEMTGKENGRFASELNFLKDPQSWYVLLITAIGFGGFFAWLSYISPLMTDVTGIKENNMAYIMILAGSGMVAGNFLGGYLTDQVGVAKASLFLLSAMLVSLLGVFVLSGYTTVSLVLTFFCGVFSMSLNAPVHTMMINAAPASEMMSLSFVQAAFNIANATGAYLGGLPIVYGLSYAYPSLVGVGLTMIGIIICVRYVSKYLTQRTALIKQIK